MNDDEAFEELCPSSEGAFLQLSTAWDLLCEGAYQCYYEDITAGKPESETLFELCKQVIDGINSQVSAESDAPFAFAGILAMGLIKVAREKYNAREM